MKKIIGDIGATHFRLALYDNKQGIHAVKVVFCNDFPSPAAAIQSYLASLGVKPKEGALAIATPITGDDHITLTNHPWSFSLEETRKDCGLKSLKAVNDFAALGWSIPVLEEKDFYKLGGGAAIKGMPIGIIGPGTGLGVAGLVFCDEKPVIVASEGGHVTMPATTARELAVFDFLKRAKYKHISAEKVVSGKGLLNLYQAIGAIKGMGLPQKSPAEITAAGITGKCKVCAESLDLFCHFLGIVAGNLALTYGATGGIYIGGGIVPQLGEFFVKSRFRESFEAKGRFREYMERIPTFVITHPTPALEGLRNLISLSKG